MRRAGIGLATAVASLATAALLPATGGAAFLGDNGPILFTASAAGSPAPDVWSVYPDGSGLVNLTDLPGGAGEGRDPSASAGGTVAFTAGSGPNAEIWTMNLDGSAPRQVTSNAAGDELPALSPDGSLIAFVSERDGAGDLDVWTAAFDGTAQGLLLDGAGRDLDPVFTPDGEHVLTASEISGDLDIGYVPAAGGPYPAATAITAQSDEHETSPSPTPDGIRLAYGRSAGGVDDIFSAYYNGTDEFAVATDPGAAESEPAYSPDGTKLVYVRDGALVIAESGGASPQPLTTGIAANPASPEWAVGTAPDSEPPQTRITRSPKRRSEKTRAKFRFTASEPGSSFECRLDRRGFKPCASPRRYRGLKARRHSFRVRAIDAAGNVDPSPAKAAFRVLRADRE